MIQWRRADGGYRAGINARCCALGLASRRGSGFRISAARYVSQLSAVARCSADRSIGGTVVQDGVHGQRRRNRNHPWSCNRSFLFLAAAGDAALMMYQLGWSTLPGLRGLSCSDFRATPTTTPDNERGVAIELAGESERDQFLRKLEEHFAARRFGNAADAFDTVKAYVLEQSKG